MILFSPPLSPATLDMGVEMLDTDNVDTTAQWTGVHGSTASQVTVSLSTCWAKPSSPTEATFPALRALP